jgi:hypothetical protein
MASSLLSSHGQQFAIELIGVAVRAAADRDHLAAGVAHRRDQARYRWRYGGRRAAPPYERMAPTSKPAADVGVNTVSHEIPGELCE